jgi:type IV pilus assembly protein PilN
VATINLLPWRAELKEALKQRFFFHLIMAVIFSFLFVFFLHLTISNRLNIHLKRNAYLQNAITTYDQTVAEVKELEKQKQQLTVQLNHIQQLSTERANMVRLFDNLVRVIPSGVYLTSIQRHKSKVTLMGEANSNVQVSELMRLIDKSYSFSKAILTEIKSNEVNKNGNDSETSKEAAGNFSLEIQMG